MKNFEGGGRGKLESPTLHLGVERSDVILRVPVRARDDLRHHHRRLRPLRHDIVDQAAQARVRGLPTVSSAVIGAGVQKHDVGADASVGNAVGRARDLIDHPARMTLVVFVGHGA